ncbi:MAG: HDOD domain-containing protein [Kiloniellales bacterium]|nr:HDOD domain-containing protein [Kiloniellales bacterium]
MNPAAELSVAEPSIADRLGDIRPSDLPSPPEAAIRIIEACASKSTDSRKLSEIVSTDPGLAAEILRIVNSAYFGFGGQIRTLSRGISILGERALRNLVFCVAIRDALGSGAVEGVDTARFWEAALHRAVAARLLGERVGLSPDECFTVGLLLDIGLLAMVFSRPDAAPLWDAMQRADPDSRYALERDTFGATHDDVGHALVHAWKLPEDLARVLGGHHRARRAEDAGSRMCRMAYSADWLACIATAEDRPQAMRRTRQVLSRLWGWSEEACDELMASTLDNVEQAGAAFGLQIKSDIRFDDVLREANLVLAEENLTFQELNWRLQHSLSERDALAERIQRELDKARVIQRSLLPLPSRPEPLEKRASCPFVGINAPARELSGDLFDYFRLRDGRYYFALADVSGKGMDAALLMAKTSSLFHCLGKLVHEPRKLMALINAELCELSVHGMFVTMAAGLYDPGERTVELVNAGHPPALLFDARGASSVVPAQAPPLGIVPGCDYRTETRRLGEGCMYLFSDGLIEAPAKDGSRHNYDDTVKLLRDLSEVPARQRLARVIGELGRTHSLSDDDITILLLEP